MTDDCRPKIGEEGVYREICVGNVIVAQAAVLLLYEKFCSAQKQQQLQQQQ